MTKLEELKLARDKANKVWDKAYDAYQDEKNRLNKED
jgi:hypothetical protein